MNIVAVKVLDYNGDGTHEQIIAGIEWVMNDAQRRKATANLSLRTSISAASEKSVRALHNSGVPMFCCWERG